MTREEAKAFINSLVKLRGLATDEMSLQVPNLYPEWRSEEEYEVGDRVLYNDVLYKVLQAHISQETWTPDASASLFAKVLIPDSETIYPWEQPDSTNTYSKDDKVTHNGRTWISIVDNNSWEPGVFGWEEIE